MGITQKQAAQIRGVWAKQIEEIALAAKVAGFSDIAKCLNTYSKAVLAKEYHTRKMSSRCLRCLAESASADDQVTADLWLSRYQAIEMLLTEYEPEEFDDDEPAF